MAGTRPRKALVASSTRWARTEPPAVGSPARRAPPSRRCVERRRARTALALRARVTAVCSNSPHAQAEAPWPAGPTPAGPGRRGPRRRGPTGPRGRSASAPRPRASSRSSSSTFSPKRSCSSAASARSGTCQGAVAKVSSPVRSTPASMPWRSRLASRSSKFSVAEPLQLVDLVGEVVERRWPGRGSATPTGTRRCGRTHRCRPRRPRAPRRRGRAAPPSPAPRPTGR